MAPSHKLTYFDLKGRAELSRLVFAVAGVEYEDNRITFAEWPSLKATMPFEQMPVLEIDGRQYAQSFAIANYLANEFGLRGESNEETLEIDQLLELIKEFIFYLNISFKEPDANKKAEYMKEAVNVHSVKFLKLFQRLIEGKESGFFVGSKLTIADLAVFDITDWITERNPKAIEDFPGLITFREKICNIDNIRKYLDQQKK